MAASISSSPAMLLMPRTSVSTFLPELYSLGPKAVLGTSGANVIRVKGIRTSSYAGLVFATFMVL